VLPGEPTFIIKGMSFPDAWIAAAALQLNIPLVTHNASDYEAIESLTILTATTMRPSGS